MYEMQEKQTILLILHMPPPVHGAAMMGKYIHDSKVINEAFDCHYINLTTAKDLQDIGKGGLKKMWKFLRLLKTICKEVKRLRPQLVYVTPNAKGGAFYKDFVVVQMLKLLGCKVVVHYHNKGVAMRQDYWLDDKLYKCFFKNIKVILLADALYQDVKKYVRRSDVFICPNGIPETLSKELVAKRENKVPHILFLSNLLIGKGVLVLLDACKILKDKGYSFICDFVGSETTEINSVRFEEEVVKRGLKGLVMFHGKKYSKEKDVFFYDADVFVFPTYYDNECFPLVLLEAMEHGLPCISTKEGGISAIIEDGINGFLVEKQQPKVVADRIECLMFNPDVRIAMGKNGREKFKREFTLVRFENRMRTVLGEILALSFLKVTIKNKVR